MYFTVHFLFTLEYLNAFCTPLHDLHARIFTELDSSSVKVETRMFVGVVLFRLQTSASNSERIDVGQMSQKIHAPVAMDLQQNRSTHRNCPCSIQYQPFFAPTSQITCSFEYLKQIQPLCFGNKLASVCRCFFAGPAVWTNHLQVRFAEMPLPAHFGVELLQFWFKQHACPLSCGCSLFRNEGRGS